MNFQVICKVMPGAAISRAARIRAATFSAAIVGASLLGIITLSSASADETDERFVQRESVREYIRQISREHDLDPNRITGLFSRLTRQQSILDAISRPAERTLTWKDYRPIFVTEDRINGGKRFAEEHRALLEKAQARFGVPAEIITAIIGVETYYGRITGSYRVLEALATLAFDYPRRAEFFSSEMTEFILLSEAEGWPTVNVMGSYAGAMGMPQFIASSYRQYAIDFDDDGKRDLFDNPADIIGSVANYLAGHNWEAGAPIAERWQPEPGISDSMRELVRESLQPAIAADTVRALGFDSQDLSRATASNHHLSVMTMDGADEQELWIGYRNFYAITRYNHSRLYAMAVYQLAQAIGPL